MNVFIGLDVSLASTAICIVTEHGKIVKETTEDSDPDALVRFLRDVSHQVVLVGLEAGPLSQWLHKGLTDAGFEAVLMETRQVKGALKAMPIKTDRRDAEGGEYRKAGGSCRFVDWLAVRNGCPKLYACPIYHQVSLGTCFCPVSETGRFWTGYIIC